MYPPCLIRCLVVKMNSTRSPGIWKVPCRKAQGHVYVSDQPICLSTMNNTYYLNDLDISGVPGTGKTATVLEVIRGLQYRSEQDVEVCATLYSQWDETTNSFYE